MIRFIKPSDLPKLKEITPDFDWEIDSSFVEGMVYTDDKDQPVLFVGAWQRAEVHVATDNSWSTPGARLFAMQQLHDAMEKTLKNRGFTQVVTWFDEGIDRFKMRLRTWGWVESQKKSWHRRIF